MTEEETKTLRADLEECTRQRNELARRLGHYQQSLDAAEGKEKDRGGWFIMGVAFGVVLVIATQVML